MLRCIICLPWLPISVAATDLITFNLGKAYTSTDWTEYQETFKKIRNTGGTINGPLPVQPNAPSQEYDYDVDGYLSNFKKLGTKWVRFQDLSLTHGGTSMTQIFSAWPLTDEDLTSADIEELASNPKNYNFTVLDENVQAALDAGASLDFRLGDSHQVASLLSSGGAVQGVGGTKNVTFPSDWAFPTNINSQKGLDLWSAVALEVAAHVWALAGSDAEKVAFDLLTETTADGNVFWPFTAEMYATLYSAVMPKLKRRFGSKVKCIGPNTAGPQKGFLADFLNACGQMGYADCPLDVVSFHIFTYTASTYIPTNAKWVYKQMGKYLDGWTTMPHMAMTAWGFHGSGAYDYNNNATGAALMANSLISIENIPFDFMIYYKWAGINCGTSGTGVPCLVVNLSGDLKHPAIPFVFHSRLMAIGTDRIYSASEKVLSIAARSSNNRSIAALIAPPTSDGGSSVPSQVRVYYMSCARSESVKLTIEYAVEELEDSGAGATKSITISGQLNDDHLFVDSGSSSPYTISSHCTRYAALLVLSCEGAHARIFV